jgi:hypothetical protein
MQDPENIDEILEKIGTIRTMGEIFELIDKTFPSWVIHIVDNFSEDYLFLDQNWQNICKELNVRKAKIIIVRQISLISEESNTKLVKIFCELLTKAGFIVRDVNDLQLCLKCGNALPTEGMYNTLKKMNVSVPEEYISNCSKC